MRTGGFANAVHGDVRCSNADNAIEWLVAVMSQSSLTKTAAQHVGSSGTFPLSATLKLDLISGPR